MGIMVYGQRVIRELEDLGFRHTFNIRGGLLHCTETDQYYEAESVSLWATFRYEGFSDPDSNQILYALEADDGSRGVISDAYGVYADPDLAEFIEMVHDRRHDSQLIQTVPASREIRIVADRAGATYSVN